MTSVAQNGQVDVALATYEKLPHLDPDDGPLVDALVRRGLRIAPLVWDDPTADFARARLCLIRSTWDYFNDKRERFVAWAESTAAGTELWNPADAIRWNSDKRYLRELEARGVSILPTLWIEPGADVDLAAELADRGWRDAIVKPAIDGGAQRLLRARTGRSGRDRAQTHLEELLADGTALVQPFLASLERDGELSLVFVDGRHTHAVRKRPAPADFRVQPEWGGSSERVEAAPQELEAAEAVLSAVGRELMYARVDLVRDDAGALCLMELEIIEPRLFLREAPEAAEALADAVTARLADGSARR